MLRIAYLAAGVVVFAVTLLPRGATLIYLWPWPLILTLALAVPPAAIAVRLLRGEKTPNPGKLVTAGLTTLVIVLLASAGTSPYPDAAGTALLLPLAAIALVFEVRLWREIDPATDEILERALAWMLLIFSFESLVLWLTTIAIPNGFHGIWEERNPHPLGHSNYTAGALLLLLPFGAARAWRGVGRVRLGWILGLILAALCLFTAGSRAAILGLGAGAVAAAVLLIRSNLLPLRRALLFAGVCCVAAAVIAIANPRIRGMLRSSAAVVPDDSTLQRSAMLAVGKEMVRARPALGWGPGTTPLAYPRFRTDVSGGVDSALQLHNTPMQIAADLGFPGLALLTLISLAGFVSCWRACREPEGDKLPVAAVAGVSLAAYGAFAFYDFEFDVPFFAIVAAIVFALCLSRSASSAVPLRLTRVVIAVALIGALIWRVPSLRSHWRLAAAADALEQKDDGDFRKLAELAARADPADTAALNALGFHFGEEAIADNTGSRGKLAQLAEGYFAASLQRNPDQEIAETNLAWLLLPDDPAAAERHFLRSAALLPEKEGLGVGLARARSARGNRDGTVSALAAECLMNPPYLFSPDWRSAPFADLQHDVLTTVTARADALAQSSSLAEWQKSELVCVGTVASWLAGKKKSADVAAVALNPGQRQFFSSGNAQALLEGRPLLEAVVSQGGPVGDQLIMRARRPGYGVLMRNLDAPMPADFYWSRHDRAVVVEGANLVPARLHLPGRILLAELEAHASAPR
ncbi:MAG TPA: bifunctional O-antigen ligase/aminoglycoside phosphotransferase family protein [Candidatus Didemnitutus sp.]|nr:bifunctional O-antigen ligase/aminoglycoside phosphotransferase family protein [Candidatus Didemnitutus sp.]